MTADDPQARWVRRATLLTALAALVVVSWPRTQTMSPTGSAPAPRPSTDPTPTVPAVWPAPSPTALAAPWPSAATPAGAPDTYSIPLPLLAGVIAPLRSSL